MLTHSITPNQIKAASGPTTGVSTLCAIGPISGRMMKAISKKSRKKAKKKMKRLMKIRKPHTPPGKDSAYPPATCCRRTPRNTTEKQVDPIRMKTTIAVIRMVVS